MPATPASKVSSRVGDGSRDWQRSRMQGDKGVAAIPVPPISGPSHHTYTQIVQDTEVGKRMAGLESRVVELTEAVGALAAEQRKVVAAASKRPPSAAISKAATRRERYERLPPPSASGHADFWKP